MRDRDDIIRQDAWFFVERFPKARFVTQRFKPLGEGRDLAELTARFAEASQAALAIPQQDKTPKTVEAKAFAQVAWFRDDFSTMSQQALLGRILVLLHMHLPSDEKKKEEEEGVWIWVIVGIVVLLVVVVGYIVVRRK